MDIRTVCWDGVELVALAEVWAGSAGNYSHLYDTKFSQKRAALAGPMSAERMIIEL